MHCYSHLHIDAETQFFCICGWQARTGPETLCRVSVASRIANILVLYSCTHWPLRISVVMSQATPAASSPEPEPSLHISTLFSIQVTYHVPVLKSSSGASSKGRGKGQLKTKKETKSKELSFSVNESNFVVFLEALLKIHNEKKYCVTAQKPFSFKYYYHSQS